MAPFATHDGHTAEYQDIDTDRWTVPDLMDFDYYVDDDERLAHESAAQRKRLQERDRRLYREQIEQAITATPEHTPRHRSRALRRWLTARRKAEDPSLRPLLPGAVFARGQRLVSIILGALGFFAGVGVASALLHYDGVHPVNVSWYVFVLVIVQILLVGATVGAWYARRSSPVRAAVQDFSLLGHLIRPLFSRAARWVQRQRLAHAPAGVRERAMAKKGLLESHYRLYGPASYLPVLIPAQVFGIGFNVGAILITIALEWFTDLAFGWGSALNVHPETIHSIAHAVALPWSWLFGEGVGFPTLEQVAGTRINLKDPLYLLNAEHLRSWRWFLVLAVFTYGLIPRLVMLGLSLLTQRRTLASLPFTHQRTQALYARMITPSLETAAGGGGAGPEMPIPAPLKPLTTPRSAPRPEVVSEPGTVARPESPPMPAAKPVERRAPPVKPKAKPTVEPPTAPAPEPKAERPAEPTALASPPPAEQQPPPEPEPKAAPEPQPKRPTEPEPGPELRQPEPATAPESESTLPRRPEPVPEPDVVTARESAPEIERPAEPEPPFMPEPQQTAAREPEPESAPEPASGPEVAPSPKSPAPTAGVEIAPDACVLLIHVDVADVLEEADHARLQQMLLQHAGWRVAASATFGGGSAMAAQALGLIENSHWQAPPARVALIQDGSQPPITEGLRFLRSVRAAAGEQAQVLLALVGDPEGDDPLPPLAEFDFSDWQRKIEQLGDPYLRLEMLAGPEEEDS